MKKDIQTSLSQTGLFAGLPVASEERTLKAIEALVAGEINGVLFAWNKQLLPMLGKVRVAFPKLLIGVQGPWAQVRDALNLGGDFVALTNPEVDPGERCVQREGNNLLALGTKRVLAQCNNKLVFAADLHKGDWPVITQRAREALHQLLGFELRHVGINNPDESGADKVAGRFEQLFHFAKEDKGGAYFAGPYIEAMKKPFYGTHGHIAIATKHPTCAAWYLQKRGARINWNSAGYNEDGSLRVVYLKDEIGGFAVHIIQK